VSTIGYGQLTLDVLPHPSAARRGDGAYIAGTLKLTGDFRVLQDLNAGDSLIVVVQNADGEVLSHHQAEVGPVTLKPIEDKDLGIIGTERIHKAKVTDEA
jgi:hypothetical protein